MHVLQSIGPCDKRLSSTDSEMAGKREPKSEQNQNQNQNLQMIAVEEHDDQPRVAVVTHEERELEKMRWKKERGLSNG
jgi:hypothetical protein